MLPGAIVEQVRNLNPRYDEEKTAENYNVQFGKAMERVGGPNWKQKRHFKHPTALLWLESSPPPRIMLYEHTCQFYGNGQPQLAICTCALTYFLVR